MKHVGALLRLISFISFAYATDASASLASFGTDAVREIFKYNGAGRRAPLLLLTPQMPNACVEVAKAIEEQARALTNVYVRDTADVRSIRDSWEVFNTPPSPSPFAGKTPFENYLDAHPYGGIVIFSNSATDGNAIVAARVAQIYKDGKHISPAGHFVTSRQAFVLQASDKVVIAKRGTLRTALPPALWRGTINECAYELVDGDQFAIRVGEADQPVEPPTVSKEPDLRTFAEDLVTRIGRASQPMLLPPVVILTAVPGYTCGQVVAKVYDVAKDTLPTYNLFPSGPATFAEPGFHKFLATERRGTILVRKSTDLGQTQLGTAQVGQFILSQWHDGPKGGYAMDRYSYVLETTAEAELMPGLSVGSLLDRAQASDVAHGCRYSLFSGISLLTLLKEHKACQPALAGS